MNRDYLTEDAFMLNYHSSFIKIKSIIHSYLSSISSIYKDSNNDFLQLADTWSNVISHRKQLYVSVIQVTLTDDKVSPFIVTFC